MTADGRLARSVKQKEAIKTALMKLVRAGNYAPSAVEVAQATGTTVRTVFRHFASLEDLHASINEQIRKESLSMVSVNITSNNLHDRFEEAVEARLHVFEQILPLVEFQFVNQHQSKLLREAYHNTLHESRMFMTLAFSEFIETSDERYAALEVALSIANWRTLRHDFAKTPEEARDLVLQTVKSLFPVNANSVVSKIAI